MRHQIAGSCTKESTQGVLSILGLHPGFNDHIDFQALKDYMLCSLCWSRPHQFHFSLWSQSIDPCLYSKMLTFLKVTLQPLHLMNWTHRSRASRYHHTYGFSKVPLQSTIGLYMFAGALPTRPSSGHQVPLDCNNQRLWMRPWTQVCQDRWILGHCKHPWQRKVTRLGFRETRKPSPS